MRTSRHVVTMLVAAFAGAAGLAMAPGAAARAQEKGPVVFAAASLKTALDAIDASWAKDTGKSAAISYAGSSALAKQIEEGAPADIFISADRDWMAYLSERKLIDEASRVELLGNSIVLVAPADSTSKIVIEKGFALGDLLGDGKLAMADTSSVPAGKYAKASLEFLGAWDQVADRIAQSENVRAALLLVSRGEAALGIVYATDAAADRGVRTLGTFPADSHPPIVYPAALTADPSSTDAEAFLDYLQGSKARAIFEEQGFAVLAPMTVK